MPGVDTSWCVVGGTLPSMAVTVLYDSDCSFCTRSIDVLVNKGASATFRPIHTAGLTELGVDPQRAAWEMPAVLSDGQIVYGAQAVQAALSTGPWWMLSLAAVMGCWPVSALTQVAYRWVAANRQHLPGGTPTCEIHDIESSGFRGGSWCGFLLDDHARAEVLEAGDETREVLARELRENEAERGLALGGQTASGGGT